MKEMTATPLSSSSRKWKPLPQQFVKIKKLNRQTPDPEGMVKIPAADFLFKVEGIEIEGFNDAVVDVQYPWEDIPPPLSRASEWQRPFFYIDKYPVTNAEFKKFMDAAHYAPKDGLDFLKDWKNGTYPDGWETAVAWVSQEDARAYAKWAHKRLPHEWEWQYAAQGIDGRIYPWRCVG